MVKTFLKTAVLICVAALAAACAGPSSAYRTAINGRIARGDLEGALRQVDSSKRTEYSRKNAVLYYLDRGALLYDLQRYKESDEAFAEADSIMESLFAKSITRGIGTVLLNDNTTEYGGEIFERAIMHTYRAMNFLMSGNRDEALVEARRVTAFLSRYSAYMENKSGYKDSPFAQYLSAMLFEEAGQQDDARISYDAFQKASEGNYAYLKNLPALRTSDSSSYSAKNSSAGAKAGMRKNRRRAAEELNNSFDEISDDSGNSGRKGASRSGEELNSSFDEITGDSENSGTPVTAEKPVVRDVYDNPMRPASKMSSNRNSSFISQSNLFEIPSYKQLAVSGLGEIVLIHYNGPAPMKVSRTMQVAWSKAQAYVNSSGYRTKEYDDRLANGIRAGVFGNAITVAYPEYVQKPYRITSSRVSVDSEDGDESGAVTTRLMEDISADAKTTMDSKNAAVMARAIARATVKYVLAKNIGDAGSKIIEKNVDGTAGQLLGLLFKAATSATAAATEVADTRGWTTVPAQIRLSRQTASPGTHRVTVTFLDGNGFTVGRQVFENVEVRAGQRTYLHCRTGL